MLALVTQGSPWALGIFLIIGAVTEVVIPTLFAIDTVVLFASYQVGLFSAQLMLVIGALLLGRLLGASFIFWISSALGQRFLTWLQKYQPKLCAQLNSVANSLAKRASLSIALARLTPGLLTAVSVGSGLVKIKFGRFALGVALSSLIADFSLVILGVIAKTGTGAFGIKPEAWQVGAAAFVFLVAGWGSYFIIQRRKAKRSFHGESCPIPQNTLQDTPKQ